MMQPTDCVTSDDLQRSLTLIARLKVSFVSASFNRTSADSAPRKRAVPLRQLIILFVKFIGCVISSAQTRQVKFGAG